MDKRGFMPDFTSALITLYDGEGEFMFRGNVRDVSEDGVLVLAEGLNDLAIFEPDQEIGFGLTLPTGRVLGRAEIAYVDDAEGRMGLKFTKILNKDGVNNLKSFVSNGHHLGSGEK
jgi:hypothetical protein